MTSVFANSKRDPKKQSKSLTYLDFSFYKPNEGSESADSIYGSSMLALLRDKKLPAWTLFCFKELTSNAENDYVPDEPAFIAEDAILLHPVKVSGGFKGLLIAQESSSEQIRAFEGADGTKYHLMVPYIETKVIAREEATLFGQ